MEPQRSKRQHRRPPMWLGAGALLLAVVAMGCHLSGRHADSVHSFADSETTCVDVDTVLIDFNEARDTIVLVLTDPIGDSDWDELSKIQFTFSSQDCDLLGGALPAYELEYHVIERPGILDPCPGAIACAFKDDATEQPHGDHNNYGKYRIYLTPDQLLLDDGSEYCSSLCKHLINHETGHALGLADPTPGPAIGQEYCQVSFGYVISWNVSIMHDEFYCGNVDRAQNLPWPSVFDMEFAEFVGNQ